MEADERCPANGGAGARAVAHTLFGNAGPVLEFCRITRRVGTSGRAAAFLLCLLLSFIPSPSWAGEVLVAVAANFLNPMKEIAELFTAESGHRVVLSPGSSGKLFAQCTHGAPYEIFFSADSERPMLLEKSGLAVQGSRFTYARGRLALWTLNGSQVVQPRDALLSTDISHLAIANPKTAPYGRAAQEVMKNWRLWNTFRPRVVQGENIAQTFQFVASGNAEYGFVALSQVRDPRFAGRGTHWVIPSALHSALRQDVVLLAEGRSNLAAQAFMEFLRDPQAQAVIERFGYGLDQPQAG